MKTSEGVFECGDLSLQRGGTLKNARIVYKTYGTLSPKRDNVIVYPTSYGAQHTDIEWLVDVQHALDPSRYFIVIPNMFGNGLSSSPSNAATKAGFPRITTFDNVTQQRRLMAELFGDRVHAAVDVGVVVLVDVVHRVHDLARRLRRGRRVEVGERVAVDLAREDRKVGAQREGVERRRGHVGGVCGSGLHRGSVPPCEAHLTRVPIPCCTVGRGAPRDCACRIIEAVAVDAPVRNPERTTDDRGHGDRPWQVIVLNDNHNTFEGVAFALSHTLPGVSYERGLELADRIHRSGRAVVWSGVREPAEHYHEQLAGFGLTMAPLEQA